MHGAKYVSPDWNRVLLLGSWVLTLLGIATYLARDGLQAADAGKLAFVLALTIPALVAFRSTAMWAWGVAGFALALPALMNIAFIGGLVYLWAPKTAYHGVAMYLIVAGLLADIIAVARAFRRHVGDRAAAGLM